MIVQKDSLINKLPRELRSRDILFLEGLRYSANMAWLSYERLRETLHEISLDRTNEIIFYSAVSDAWNVIDCANRFYNLLKQLPNKGLEALSLTTCWHEFKKIRNTFHHLDERISEKLTEQHYPIFGLLSWVYLDPGIDSTLGKLFVFAPGILQGEKSYDVPNPLGKSFNLPIDCIALTSVEKTLNTPPVKVELLPIINGIKEVISSIEENLKVIYESLPNKNETFPSDACVALLIKFENPISTK